MSRRLLTCPLSLSPLDPFRIAAEPPVQQTGQPPHLFSDTQETLSASRRVFFVAAGVAAEVVTDRPPFHGPNRVFRGEIRESWEFKTGEC